MNFTITKRYDINGSFADLDIWEGLFNPPENSMYRIHFQGDFDLIKTDGVEFETWSNKDRSITFTVPIQREADTPELDIYRDFESVVFN
jgi:hypothetical protein